MVRYPHAGVMKDVFSNLFVNLDIGTLILPVKDWESWLAVNMARALCQY